ncbi:MAG TPA: NYN domain-containing protein [Vicinamibacterales bacterium]|nr:NYN domain-containing protein [Vicinamibacterales bacterium]
MPDIRLKIAVFIDFDNIEIGVKNTLNAQFDIGVVLEALKERGDVVSKTAYGDWTRAGDYSRSLTQHATKLVQRNLTPGGDKNGADINLALDALEMAFTHTHISGYVIVGGDSDFISLVEKLKQYDKQIFVVGGRSFTSQVMQRNCHEFIAYENLIGGRGRGDRGGARGPAGPVGSQAPIEQVMPLMRRALKMLSDREVTPQLGLLKSTLLQLDSTFSERTYGVSSFRDFAEKLAAAGFVGLRESGRNILVELKEEGHHPPHLQEVRPPQADHRRGPERGPAPAGRPDDAVVVEGAPPVPTGEAPRMVEAIAEVRRLFQSAQNPPRFPMYVRQVKQFLRGVDPTFDERKFGFNSLNDLLRGCQKDGLFRMERDRQGVVRFFQGNVLKGPESARPGSIDAADIAAAERLAAQAEAEMAAQEAREREAEVVEGAVVRETEISEVVDAEEAPAPVEESVAEKPAKRKRAAAPKAAKAPREAKEKKPAKPRAAARKKAVAAGA